MVGSPEGYWDGILEIEGAREGVIVGMSLGDCEGDLDGVVEGADDGSSDGTSEGAEEGLMLIDGAILGASAKSEKTVVDMEERRKLTSWADES
jgi:hypothetical protein